MMNKGMIIAALRTALASFPANTAEASDLLKARGFDVVCTEVKHGASHTLYHLKMADDDFVIKVSKDS